MIGSNAQQGSAKGGANALIWLWLSLLVMLLDQGSKYLAVSTLSYGDPVSVLSFFDLTLLHNTGAAFSFLAGQDGWQRWFFVAIAFGMSIYLLLWLKNTPRQMVLQASALALILGGALGNVLDRVSLGYVVDFISVHWQHYYFPAFNIADSAITAGAILLIWDMVIVTKGNSQNSDVQE
ncbi:MAG: signal peptidase II [Motiliproteus sp.]